MGFDPTQCFLALQNVNGNMESALNLLLSGEELHEHSLDHGFGATAPSGGGPRRRPSPPTMVHCSFSQYSLENGRSACTCIALKAAEIILDRAKTIQDDNMGSIVTDTLLQNAIVQGVEIYNNLKRADSTMSEHKSAHEVLLTGGFPCLNQHGDVEQGMLSRSHKNDDPLGLYNLLKASHDAQEWTCVLITKPPETVLVVLSPEHNGKSFFILVDSHPRPNQFGSQGSYARIHSNLSDLVEDSLERIFPFTDLGPDIPPLMAAMYNQFDLYRFRQLQQQPKEHERPDMRQMDSLSQANDLEHQDNGSQSEMNDMGTEQRNRNQQMQDGKPTAVQTSIPGNNADQSATKDSGQKRKDPDASISDHVTQGSRLVDGSSKVRMLHGSETKDHHILEESTKSDAPLSTSGITGQANDSDGPIPMASVAKTEASLSDNNGEKCLDVTMRQDHVAAAESRLLAQPRNESEVSDISDWQLIDRTAATASVDSVDRVSEGGDPTHDDEVSL